MTHLGTTKQLEEGVGVAPVGMEPVVVQCHMTNTCMTDPEIFEQSYPVLLRRFGLRENSGDTGLHRGGDGLVREIEFSCPIVVSILSERRVHAPRELKGGKDGAQGCNALVTKDKRRVYLGGKNTIEVQADEILEILTPDGGGWVLLDPLVAKIFIGDHLLVNVLFLHHVHYSFPLATLLIVLMLL